MQVISVQWAADWLDSQTNLQRLQDWFKNQEILLNQATATQVAPVVVLPELFHCGFAMQPQNFALSLHGDFIMALKILAQHNQCYLIMGLALSHKSPDKSQASTEYYQNSALVISPLGVIVAHYAKQKLFRFANEQNYYSPGLVNCKFKINKTNCALFICYDLRFPELFRSVAKAVEVIFVIANWPESRQAHWKALLKARAIENQCFMIGVNRTGHDGLGLNYLGGSMVINPLGEVISDASVNCLQILSTIDEFQVSKVRHQLPFLEDMT